VDKSRRDALKIMGVGSTAAVFAVSGLGKLADALPTNNLKNDQSKPVNNNTTITSSLPIDWSKPLVIFVNDSEISVFQDTSELVIRNDAMLKKLLINLRSAA
jgi:hypothetical protein